jgi:hypothetical protein
VTIPQEVRLATDCAAALDRGDKKTARRLAEEGLRLSATSRNARWQRRFEHLLRVATGASIKSLPDQAPTCSFCTEKARKVVAGPKTFICDRCVRRCASERLDGSLIRRVIADDVLCSFCGVRSSEPLFGGDRYFICDACVARCVDTLAD